MPLDAVCLTALTQELAPMLVGARIDKVQQPERDMLLLSLYTREGARRLLMSAGVGSARLHFTGERPENPGTPPMFCMLMRKHLVGARITEVIQPPYERLVELRLDTRDELGVEKKKRLIAELMGRSANIILTDEDDVIIDCLRRADFGETAYRRLLPGMKYRLPPRQAKPCFFEETPESLRAAWDAHGDGRPDKWLMDAFTGLSPLTARETAYRAELSGSMPEAMEAFLDSVRAGEFTPVLVKENGEAKDFSFMFINQYGAAAQCERFPDFSSLLDAYYAGRDRAERMRRVSAETVKSVRNLRDRQARKLAQQREELKLTAGREELRKKADLITANLWRLKKGDRTLVCENYYAEGCPETEIALDTLKTPQQNAAALYKDYKKKAAAEKYLTGFIEDGEKRLFYLESVLDELSRAENERDVAEIRRELFDAGLLKKQKAAAKQKLKPRAPARFVSSSGREILVGRSNAENDELTFRTARRTDLWLHTQRVHGSHVVVRADNGEVDAASLAEAASLAAYFSQARDSGKVPVDCTAVRFVKKPSGSLPGMVVYTDYQTLMAEPDEALVRKLKA